MIYWLTHFFTKILSRLFFPCTFIGQENIPRTGSFIFASNHISNLDPVLIGISTSRRISFMAKEELFKNPILGFYLRCLETYPIKRNTTDIRAFRETLRRINEGFPVVIFPEGTRRVPGKPIQVHEGVGLIVQKSGVPVIPACVVGSDKALPPGSKFFKQHPIKMFIGKPIEFSQTESNLQIAQHIMNEIESLPQKSTAL